jgi:hypothetical protein
MNPDKMDLLELFMVLSLVTLRNAWICGDDAQCMCTFEGGVACQGISTAPRFPTRVRHGRFLTLQVSSDFDLATLDRTYGFELVTLLGLTYEQCLLVEQDFPWVRCLSQGHESLMPTVLHKLVDVTMPMTMTQTPTSKHPLSTDSTQSTSEKIELNDASETSREKMQLKDASETVTPGAGVGGNASTTSGNTDKVRTGLSPWLITGLVTGGLGFLVIILCILVSLVNLHERLNLRTRSDDNPYFAIYCCKVLMAVCLVPCHLIAKCCNCNWRGVRDLDNEMRLI